MKLLYVYNYRKILMVSKYQKHMQLVSSRIVSITRAYVQEKGGVIIII